MKAIYSISDLSVSEISSILEKAEEFRRDRWRQLPDRSLRDHVLGLVFFEASLRTRVGFAAAAARLGWRILEVLERRQSPVSEIESGSDTTRTIAGYSDAIVIRPGRPLIRDELIDVSTCAVINGGDRGPAAEHPSQALIDLFAMRQLVGPIREVRLAIVGDPRMRAVRSLLAVLARVHPASIALIADSEHIQEAELSSAGGPCIEIVSWSELVGIGVNVVYVAGIPHGALPLDRRSALLATAARIDPLPFETVLLSPMPVIDEMDASVRRDPRNRMFEQSDLGLYVRMALLEHVTRSNI